MTDKIKSVFPYAAIVIILAAAVWSVVVMDSQLRYPYLEIEADKQVKLTLLQQGSKSEATCASATNSFANAFSVGCPTCRIVQSSCLRSLSAEQEKYLGSEPLDAYSASIPNGVVVFSAPNASLAAALCKASEKPVSGNKPGVSCYAPGLSRPVSAEAGAGAMPGTSAIPATWFAILVLLFASWAYLYLYAGPGVMVGRLISLPRRNKQVFIATADLLILEITLWAAFALRFDSFYVPSGDVLMLFLLSPLLALPVFLRFGLYQSVIRYLGFQGMIAVAKAVATYSLLLVLAVYALPLAGVPRSVIVIHGTLALLVLGLGRAMARAWLNKSHAILENAVARRNVVIYGAGSAGIQLANALAHSRELRPVAFLDDDARLHRNRLGELQVYAPGELQDLIDRFQAQEVLLALPSATRQRRNQIIESLERLAVQVRTLPALSALAEGKIKTHDLREVEIDDLLGRDPVSPDLRLLKANITGKSIMVTGAGGSIGAELCRQIMTYQPAVLVLYEQSEFSLYSIERELSGPLGSAEQRRGPKLLPVLGSVTDQARLERVIRRWGVETIYHAAAYKHVPMVEQNPCDGVLNNVFGTLRCLTAAVNCGVATFVLISTDKAVRPTNTMGATKRFSELIVQAVAAEQGQERGPTRFSVVRFGNVLGSSGSVVPLFREQIRKGGPVTVTDPRIIRYFMTVSEAAELVLQAGAMGRDGDVFVLDMGSPVKIHDLAQRMIRLSGLQLTNPDQPNGDIEIVFTGLRAGEKLYEELLIGDNPSATAHPRIMRASEKTLAMKTVREFLSRMEAALTAGDSDAIRALLLEAVEDFQPQCGNEDLIAEPGQVRTS